MVLGWKPTINRFSKSVVGTNPTGENLGGPNVTVNPAATVFLVFLETGGTGGWRMAYGKLLEEPDRAGPTAIGQKTHFVASVEFFPSGHPP